MESRPKHRCARCGKRIKKGGLCYRLHAELISHYDGYLAVNPDEDLSSTLEKIDNATENLNSKELEKQVFEKFEYIVCPVCRDEIARYLRPGGGQ